MHWMPLWEIPGKVGKKSGNLRRAGEWPPWIIIIISTSKIPALRAGILLAVLLGISYRIQIGLAYCNGPKGAGRGSEKPTCIVRLGNPGLLDRLASVRGWRAEPLCGQHSWLGPWRISASTSPLHHGLATAASHWSSARCGTPTPGHGPAHSQARLASLLRRRRVLEGDDEQNYLHYITIKFMFLIKNHDVLSALSICNCSHHMREGYSSWSCFYPKSIQCPRQKYASWQRFIIRTLTNLVEYVWISWKVCVWHSYV